MGLTNEVFDTARSIFKGLAITFRELLKPPVTMHYPDERPELPKGSRGMPALKVNEDGELNCTACGMCARSCPPEVITVVMGKNEEGKPARKPEVYDIDMSRCMVCNLCVEACPFDALEMTDHFELAGYSPEDMVFDKQQLADIWKTHSAVRLAEGEKM
jgi:NADH-quinone oxidoreductase subunit I